MVYTFQSILVEMWKSTNDPSYQIQCEKLEVSEGAQTNRAISRGDLRAQGSSHKSQSSFINNASRAWNKAPQAIKICKSLYSAKITTTTTTTKRIQN